MATFTIKLNATAEYTFYNNSELDICQEVEDISKMQSTSSSGNSSSGGDIVYDKSGFFGENYRS